MGRKQIMNRNDVREAKKLRKKKWSYASIAYWMSNRSYGRPRKKISKRTVARTMKK